MKKINLPGKRFLSTLLSAGMVLSLMPANLSLAADTTIPTMYAAAYQNADVLSETTLPATVSVNGANTAINWSIRSSKFAVPYETVNVTGTTQDGTTVNAKVEVLPEAGVPLVYFVDASRDSGKESKAFDAVKALTGATLKNTVSDQVYTDASRWGRSSANNVFQEKSTGNVDVTDKYQTGWYSNAKTTPLQYQFYLEAGDYTLNAGFREWWNTSARSVKIALSGTQTDAVTSDTVTFAASSLGSNGSASVTFTVKEDSLVTMEIQNPTGGEAPVISWFAIAKGSITIPNVKPETEIIIDGSDVDTAATNKNGLTWKGYGVLSGNSTSDLLMDYKTESPEIYGQLLQELFGGEHPLMTHVKMEMGNDGNNSTGADSCTMRFENEEADASRSPGFQLAADAKAINPDVKVSFLRWEMPAWVASKWNSDKTGAGYEAVYKWYKETIFDAYEKYGYMVDYVNPDKNETTSPDTAFIKWFSNRLKSETDFPVYMNGDAQEDYKNIKIIASDENTSLNIVPALRKDTDLYNAVDAVGFHYSTGTASSTADYRTLADVDDKEVWYSEGCATFSYTEYQENKQRTSDAYGANTIGGYQSPLSLADNFIASFNFSRKTHYIFQPAIGSFYEGAQYDHKELISAREPWAGYIHYDPAIYLLEHFTKFAKTGWENEDNTAGIWRVIANATGNSSGNRGDLGHITNENGNPSYMTLAAPDKSAFSVVIVNNSSATLPYAIKAQDMNIASGAAAEIWETKTDSYMQYAGEADYADGYYTLSVEPFSMVTLTTLDCNGKEEYTSRLPQSQEKTVLDTNAAGSTADTDDKILYADDFEYSTYDANYLKDRGNEPRYAVDFSGAFAVEDGKLKQLLSASVGQWNNHAPSTVIGDFRWMNYKASVDVQVADNSYAGLNIRQQTGMNFEGSGYNLQITKDGNWTLKKRSTVISSGKVSASANGAYHLELEGRGSFITGWVNGTIVASYCDPNPEYFGRVRLGCGWAETSFDNLKVETIDEYEAYATSLTDNADDAVSYEGTWDIIAGAGGGSNDWYRSTSTTQTAGSSFSFPISGGGFALIGVNDGTAVLDIEVDETKIASDVTTNSSSNHGTTYIQYGLTDSDHTVTVTVKSGKLVLDAVKSLPYNSADISERITGVETVWGAAYEGSTPELPGTVTLTKASGETVTEEVTWNTESFSGKAYETAVASGITNTSGTPVSAKVETIPSQDKPLIYFVDAGRDGLESHAFNLVSALTGNTLKNTVPDQSYSAASGWGKSTDMFRLRTPNASDDITDKYMTGYYSNTKTDWLKYQMTLDAGTYELTAGIHEWWNNRSVTLYVSGPDTPGVTSAPMNVSTSGSLNDSTSLTFTVEKAGTVTLEMQNPSNGEAPVISWFGVAKIGEPAGDKTDLTTLINSVKDTSSTGYTDESFQAFSSALEAAQALLDDENASQSQIDEAMTALQKAFDELAELPPVVVPDKSQLTALIDSVKDTSSTGYTVESFQAFTSALEAAQALLDDENASQSQIDGAKAVLEEAYANLIIGEPDVTPEQETLDSFISTVKGVSAEDYTLESYEAFAKALAAAETVLKDTSATKEQLIAAKDALEKAYHALEKSEAPVPTPDPDPTPTPDPDPAPAPGPTPIVKVQLTAPAVTALKSSAAKTGSVVTITLSKTANADSYTVYRKVGNTVTTVGTTSGTSIKDTKPVSGKKASYYAVARSKNTEKYTDSNEGISKSITLAKDTKKVTVKKSGKTVKITFKKVTGAKGYLVYRATKKNGTYTKLTKKPIRKLTYTDKKVTAKASYYYKIVTLNKAKTYSAGKISKKISIK